MLDSILTGAAGYAIGSSLGRTGGSSDVVSHRLLKDISSKLSQIEKKIPKQTKETVELTYIECSTEELKIKKKIIIRKKSILFVESTNNKDKFDYFVKLNLDHEINGSKTITVLEDYEMVMNKLDY